ncbi:alpha/beta fold hydrolase [Trabulsiella odontotermitis]|uniref:alpha/beta fold hydrolase n=1 Tax=Trabulsiella odontotermitis TaxID=379893 RepID=UPI000F612259
MLEKRYHTVAVELRGHGRSEVMPAGLYRPDHYAADIISLIETKFTREKFTLIGHSRGSNCGPCCRFPTGPGRCRCLR